MSILHQVLAAVTPQQSLEARQQAHAKARRLAQPGDWLDQILDHHDAVREAFDDLRLATAEAARAEAQAYLGVILMGHAIAEEAAIYPAMALGDQKGHADQGYSEQAAVKVQMAALDELPKMSDEYLEKLEKIEAAVLQHMFEEEDLWYPRLRQSEANHQKLTLLYETEFDAYTGDETDE